MTNPTGNALLARIKELEEALKPFADLRVGVEEQFKNEEWFRHDGDVLYVKDFLKARKALHK